MKRYLIDTHILLWLLYEPHKVKSRIREAMEEGEAHISLISLWEIIIKASLGKYALPAHFLHRLEEADTRMLPLSLPHLEAVWRLPHHHGDPFDRLLIAQAVCEKLTLITHDRRFQAYDAKILLA